MFQDRYDAAQQLATSLTDYKNKDNVVVIAIPRGGLEIGFVLARELDAPLDVLFSKKIAAPGNPEAAIGAVTQTHEIITPRFAENQTYTHHILREKERVRALLAEREKQYRKERAPISLNNKIVILTDDGIATGNTVFLALKTIRAQNPKKIIVALPVAPADAMPKLSRLADEVVCLLQPHTFFGISQFYNRFDQVSDDEAIRLLTEANQ